MQLQSDRLLQGGKYRIERVLGQGGFGITYQAVQVALNRKVAIKEFFMKEYCNRDSETSHVSVPSEGSKELVGKFRQKFIKEAQNIAALNHPHIIRIHDIFEENGTAYYVMEYCDKGSLGELVKRQGALGEAEALRYIRQVADALGYIHERKMNHLDVKPGNILLDENRNAVLIDFGLSKRYDEEGNQTSTTPVGISHGYAPLEQYKKGGVGTFSPATDIYSLGATLYKLLTGQTPPEATELMDEELPSLPANISPATVSAIKKAMQVGRKSRSQNIKEFLSLLGNVDPVMNEQPEKNIKEEVEEVTVFIETEMASQEDEEQPCTDNDKSDFIDGHEYVDLGLSVKWAACNIGAEKPEDYGDYFAWGETKPKMEYSESTYEYSVRKFLYYKYFDLGKNISDTQYDAAHANWGGGWRLPIKAELDELKRKCTWTWTTRGGHNGYKVTGPNGNSIFLPAAGYRAGALCCNIGKSGIYWDSTPHEKHMQNAYYLDFRSSYYNIEWGCRYYGLSLRPVIE